MRVSSHIIFAFITLISSVLGKNKDKNERGLGILTKVTSNTTINMNTCKRADPNNVTTEASGTNGKKLFVRSSYPSN